MNKWINEWTALYLPQLPHDGSVSTTNMTILGQPEKITLIERKKEINKKIRPGNIDLKYNQNDWQKL